MQNNSYAYFAQHPNMSQSWQNAPQQPASNLYLSQQQILQPSPIPVQQQQVHSPQGSPQINLPPVPKSNPNSSGPQAFQSQSLQSLALQQHQQQQQQQLAIALSSDVRAKIEIVEGAKTTKRRFTIQQANFNFLGIEKIIESIAELSLEGSDLFYFDSEDDAIILQSEADWKEAEREFSLMRQKCKPYEDFVAKFKIVSSIDTPVFVTYPPIPQPPLYNLTVPQAPPQIQLPQQASAPAAQQQLQQQAKPQQVVTPSAPSVVAPRTPKVHSFTLVIEQNKSNGDLEIKETKNASQAIKGIMAPAVMAPVLTDLIRFEADESIPDDSEFEKASQTPIRKAWRFKNISNTVFPIGSLFTRLTAKQPNNANFPTISEDEFVTKEVKPGESFIVEKTYKVPDNTTGTHRLTYQLVWKHDNVETVLVPEAWIQIVVK